MVKKKQISSDLKNQTNRGVPDAENGQTSTVRQPLDLDTTFKSKVDIDLISFIF